MIEKRYGGNPKQARKDPSKKQKKLLQITVLGFRQTPGVKLAEPHDAIRTKTTVIWTWFLKKIVSLSVKQWKANDSLIQWVRDTSSYQGEITENIWWDRGELLHLDIRQDFQGMSTRRNIPRLVEKAKDGVVSKTADHVRYKRVFHNRLHRGNSSMCFDAST